MRKEAISSENEGKYSFLAPGKSCMCINLSLTCLFVLAFQDIRPFKGFVKSNKFHKLLILVF